jgi:multiple sugar transport system ATP-binding protein
MPAVELDHVTKVFPPAISALDDVCLNVGQGELLVLVGPSGCGKTTALRIIAGLESPTRGHVRFSGNDMTHVSPRDRDVAMVFQKSTLYPHLTVRKNLAFGLRMRSASWLPTRRRHMNEVIEERVAEAARILEIEHLLERRPAQLSGGQQQRVALGRAMVRQPRVFLLDEPLSHLDFRLRAELRRELHLLHQRLRGTMLYVTHDPTEALALGHRVALLDRGRLRQCDTPATIYERPADRTVAEFFGWPPMNFLEGSVANENGRTLWRFAADAVLAAPAGLDDQQITLGIRPENVFVRLPESTIEQSSRIASLGRMQATQIDGQMITLQRGHCQVIGTAKGNGTGTVGQELDVMIDSTQTHWFDSTSGRALAHGVPTG